MGLTISYKARLAKRADVSGFLDAARQEAKARGWKVERAKPGAAALTLLPHARSESILFDFTKSLTCEHFVKTIYAPPGTHVQIVEFLRAMEPFLRLLVVEDECEFWETGDRKLLKKHRDRFAKATGKKRPGPADKPVTFTLGAVVIKGGF